MSEPIVRDRFDAVILDMDGVITDTATVHERAWKEMFDEYLKTRNVRGESHAPFRSPDDYLEYVDGKPRYDGVDSFLKSRGIELPRGEPQDPPDKETVCGLGNRKNELFHEIVERDGVDVFEDTVGLIRRWREEGFKTAVVSSSRNCEKILKIAKLLQLFDARVDGQTAREQNLNGKPAPDYFLRAAELIGVEPARAVVVEDAISGVQAGRAGDFGLVVGVARSDNADALRQNGADVVVSTLGELTEA